MTTKVVVANPGNKLSQVMEFFTLFKVQHIPVVENDQLIGIISVNDLMSFLHSHLQNEALSEAYLDSHFSLENIMTKNPVTFKPDDKMDDALETLRDGVFQAIPICENGVIKGILTNKDVVRAYFRERHQPNAGYSSDAPGFGV